jgi:hypothetical protein
VVGSHKAILDVTRKLHNCAQSFFCNIHVFGSEGPPMDVDLLYLFAVQ